MDFTYKNLPKLSDRLKYVRQVKNLTQAECAQMIGTTQQALQQAETGKARQPRYLHMMARVLSVSFEWLAFNDMPSDTPERKQNMKAQLSERESDVISQFRSLTKKEQDLILSIMNTHSAKNKK
ncbi:MAG: helix-turn-helix domain-containing protein [Alphaproteobacteria bacterium]|nr:helix-turn-helix domain-containing protein [Alphaproteobacteria bacterium]